MEHHRKLIYTARMPIRWGDMDALGHVNNTVYFRFMEQARIEWLEALGFGVGAIHAESPVIVNASCTFLIPLVYPGMVECHMFAGAAGRSSVHTYYEIRLENDPRLFAEGAAKVVWMSPATGKSVALPEGVIGAAT